MLYTALAFLVVAIVTFALDYAGVIHGAAGVSNVALLASFLLLVATAIRTLPHRQRHQH